MMRLLVILFVLTTTAARAEFVLSDMVGVWSGSGTYSEAMSKARMRCRVTVTGDDTKVTLAGRCGSSLGADDVVLDFTRQGDGQIVVRSGPGAPQNDTAIQQLTGRPTATQLNVSGAAGHDSVAMQFVKNTDGSMYFATRRKWQTGSSHSSVTLVSR